MAGPGENEGNSNFLLNVYQNCRYAIVTLDGTIMLVDNCDKPPMESIMWNLQVRYPYPDY